MPDNHEDESLGQFNPAFALPDLELIKSFAVSSTKVLPEEQSKEIKELLRTNLHPGEEVEDVHALGYVFMLGTLQIKGDFARGLGEMTNDKEKLFYALKMSRRDKYIQYTGKYYTIGYGAIETNDPQDIDHPETWNFKTGEEAFEFIKKFNDLADNDVRFNTFLGRIMFFLERRRVSEEGGAGQVEEDPKFARVGMLNFVLFNQMYPVEGEKRREVLEGLAIPPEMTPLLNLMDENFVNKLLENEDESIELARFVAGYFTYFNARPWYN